jgi:ATP-dependent Clp protease protease subunit
MKIKTNKDESSEPKPEESEQETKTISTGNQIFMFGEVNPTSVAQITVAFREATNGNRNPVDVFISSGGGWVEGGFTLYDLFRSVPNTVRTYGMGMVGSIANLLLVAGDERYMYKNCKLYLHEGYSTLHGNFREQEMASYGLEVSRMSQTYYSCMSKNSKPSVEDYIKMCKDETYLSSMECAKLGIIDYIINDFPKKKLFNKSNFKKKKVRK